MRTDDELIAALRAGERTAFEVLFERHRDAIWRFFRRRVTDPEQAADLSQETFLALLQGAATYEGHGAFRSYLYGIAFNVLGAARRRSAGRATTTLNGELVRHVADPGEQIWVRTALAALDADDREVVMLREFDGLTYDEIAALLGVPVGTVRSRLFRARQALRDKLEGEPARQGAVQ